MTKNEKQWLSDVASQGCIACRNLGLGASLAEIHHRACYPTDFHAAPKTWQVIHGTEIELLVQVKREVEEVRLCRV
ncbi:conserved protein of unknown function [Xenorhabdus poinarii G6]|uniref:Uncharacterized protein n=1 Tax=Xenorhabdus poinarii G6 TaxID=1354304 RepID=A0A068R1J4_9GAMM|nr:hypothetical protein [Xenorhabdus poinarii]CDG20919.1 conserved protein of unknown function [Xenorhabdus poinarii G6]